MTSRPAKPLARPLKGWRARVWAWVLFAALLKGLIPHAALAAVLMHGDPAAIYCGAGSAVGKALTAVEAGLAHAGHAQCVCASAGDGALPAAQIAIAPVLPEADAAARRFAPEIARAPARLPPPRGPPA